jgi:hypothetical protein
MKTSKGSFLGLCLSVSLFCGCASTHVLLPPTATNYRVSAEGSGEMDGVETVEIKGDWVILDGRRMIPREKIDFIRADRPKPSEIKARSGRR